MVIDTNGSNFDTLLGVYTGNAVDSLMLIAGDNDGGPNLTSRVAFSATAGVIYQIAVDGTNGASGNIQLNLVLTRRHSRAWEQLHPGISTRRPTEIR